MSYERFFHQTTGRDRPFPYQQRLAQGHWPDVLNVPTGLGKTAAVVVAWLYRRLHGIADTPRRLVYCLPMRTLVEQTAAEARVWIERAAERFAATDLPGVHILMGGEIDDDAWVREPERAAVIVGTQDMLLSRALMRGYGMSRYHWPVHFALLHNDSLWVFDEVQLMGAGLATSTQLEAFRRRFPAGLPSRSLWVSATLDRRWLGTVDFRPHLDSLRVTELDEEDRRHREVEERRGAQKRLARLDLALDRATAKEYPGRVAEAVRARHRPGATTIVVVNRVSRAQEIYKALEKQLGTAAKERLLLVHSRFRQQERRAQLGRLPRRDDPPERKDLIVVTTQALEAGVDVSSAVLFTELAPWSSLVQRFGRCNRYGEIGQGAEAYWIDIDPSEDAKLALPYDAVELASARDRLAGLASASPADLPPADAPLPPTQVIRRKDLIELFNTEPDLTGFDVDVSPYIRDADGTDVRLFWRDLDEDRLQEQPAPAREEICPAAIGQVRDWLRTGRPKAYIWDPLGDRRSDEGRWVPCTADRLFPGQTVMIAAETGGYDLNLGFLQSVKARVPTLAPGVDGKPADMGGDRRSQNRPYVSLIRHLKHVEEAARGLCERLKIEDSAHPIVTAARWHDVGKAHEVFQTTMRCDLDDAHPCRSILLAKSRNRARHKRPYFRHELASALAWLERGAEGPDKDLIAFLIAAHHGKVRTGIRAVPGEIEPEDGTIRFARGIHDGDPLPEVVLPGGEVVPETRLRLDVMELGGGSSGRSWAERTQRLLAEHGPFRLAWLEALVAIADWRASRAEQDRGEDDV